MTPADSSPDSPPAVDSGLSFRKLATDALRYWEPRRLIYNAVLAAVVLTHFAIHWPASRLAITPTGILFLFVLAVLANVCYCAAYIADIFVQFTGFRDWWIQWRWLLLVLGIAFAGAITHLFSQGLFAPLPI